MEYMLIRCDGCSRGACKVRCKEEALSLVAGDLLLVTEKCSVCERYKGYKMPECIAECPETHLKYVVKEKDLSLKRRLALEADDIYAAFAPKPGRW